MAVPVIEQVDSRMCITLIRCVRSIRTCALVALALGSTPPRAIAQVASPPLTLVDAIALAVESNPDVRRAREQIEEFRLQVRNARSEALPTVDLVATFQRTRDPGLRNSQFFSRLGPLPAEALNPFFFGTYFYRVDVEQPIYEFGRVGHALEAARKELEGVHADLRAVENRIARDVAFAYYDLLLARERRAVFESQLRTRERQAAFVRARLELEDATRLDMLTSEVALANLRPEIIAADNTIRVAGARLNETLGRAVSSVVGPLDVLAVPDTMPTIPDVAALKDIAVELRPEIQRFGLDRAVLGEARAVTRADTLPKITANATVGLNSFAFGNLTKPSFHNWTTGVTVRWTLFDGFKTASTMAQFESQRRQSQHLEQAFMAELERELERVVGDWERSLETMDVTMLTVSQAREAERVAEESFQFGAATVLDVLTAQQALQQSELNRVTANHGALTALADLKTIVGLRADAPDSLLTADPMQRIAAVIAREPPATR